MGTTAREFAMRAQALHRARHLRHAAELYRRTAMLAPDWVEAWINLALCELETGDAAPALDAARRAAQLAPRREAAWEVYSRAAIAADAPEEALDVLRRLAELAPTEPRHLHRLAAGLRNRHDFRAARAAFDALATLDPDFLPARWEALQAVPLVLDSAPEADRLVADYESRLAEFEALAPDDARLRFFAGALVEASTNFGLHCLGRALPELQRRYARVVQRHARLWSAAPALAERARGRRIRVGFVSPSLHHHTVGRLLRGFPLGLPRERFEVTLIDVGGPIDAALDALCAQVEQRVDVGADLRGAPARIAACALDALVFVDVGMDWRMQFLASFRLARTQYALWGHPVTTGFDTIDRFVSSDAMEPADGERHYTETLVRLPNLGARYVPPATAPAARSERKPGAPIRYFCPQGAFKLLPAHDALFARVLAATPGSQLTLLPHPGTGVCGLLAGRMRPVFAAHGVDFERRVTLAPCRPEADYFRELAGSDVLLDTIGWSGGMTSLDALGLGVPVVTLPGATMRARQTYGMLRVLGREAEAACDADDYVRRAVQLGERVLCGERHRVAPAGALHDDSAPIEAFAEVLERDCRR